MITRYFPANLALLLFCMMLAASASAQDRKTQKAPFGLAWGASVEQIKALGVELKNSDGREFGKTYLASRVPSVLADQEATFLSFGYDNKLWRIAAVSRQFRNDPYGASVRTRYSELSNLLEQKYGKRTSYERLGGSIYSQPRYFLAGVRDGNSTWGAGFNASEVNVTIDIAAEDSSTARWRIVFENKNLRTSFHAAKRTKEKGAL